MRSNNKDSQLIAQQYVRTLFCLSRTAFPTGVWAWHESGVDLALTIGNQVVYKPRGIAFYIYNLQTELGITTRVS